MKKIVQIIIKEFLQIKRDKKMLAIIFMAPILQLVFLGYAANMDVDVVHATIYDQDKTVTSRNFIELVKENSYFQIDYNVQSYDEITDLLNSGKTLVAIIIPKDFEKKINRRETAQLQTLFEGSDASKASIAMGYLQGITTKFSQNIVTDVKDKLGMKLAISGSITPEVRIWYNPEMKSRIYMVPGILALILMILTISLMSMAIVREREIGTMEQLIVTPIKTYQLLLGKLIPFTIIGFIILVIIMLIMTIWFGIEIRGNRLFFLFTAFLFVLSNLGIGLFISTISKTQQQAMMSSIFALMMPMIYLSGFAFPIENMPKFFQYLTYLIPLKYFIIIIRGVILKGLGFTALWVEVLVLFLMGISLLFLSANRFSKKVD